VLDAKSWKIIFTLAAIGALTQGQPRPRSSRRLSARSTKEQKRTFGLCCCSMSLRWAYRMVMPQPWVHILPGSAFRCRSSPAALG
jgi:hypothetical protein